MGNDVDVFLFWFGIYHKGAGSESAHVGVLSADVDVDAFGAENVVV